MRAGSMLTPSVILAHHENAESIIRAVSAESVIEDLVRVAASEAPRESSQVAAH